MVSLNLVRTLISLNLDEGANGSWRKEFYSSLIATDFSAVFSKLFSIRGQVYSIDNFSQKKTQVSVYDSGKLKLIYSKPGADNNHVSFIIPYHIRIK